jgi:hypothetical protein
MPSIPAAAHVVAWAVLGTGLGFVLVGQKEAAKRLEAVETARAGAPSSDGAAAADPQKEARIATLEGQLKATESRRQTELGDVRKEVQKLWAEFLRAPEGGAAAGKAPSDAAFEEALRGVVDRYAMESKFRDTIQKATGPVVPKKPQFDQLSRALKLRPEQASRFQEEIRGIQTELYQLLQLPRADGVALWDEIMQAEQFPEGSPKKSEVFLKLFKLTIPDTQETYVERAVALASRVKEGTHAYFDTDQTATLDSLDLDWFGIKIPQ